MTLPASHNATAAAAPHPTASKGGEADPSPASPPSPIKTHAAVAAATEAAAVRSQPAGLGPLQTRFRAWADSLPASQLGISYGLLSAACFGAVCFLAHAMAQPSTPFAAITGLPLPSQQVLFARTVISLVWALPFVWQCIPGLLNLRQHGGLWIRACFSAASISITFYNVQTVGAAPAVLMVDCALIVVVLVGWLQGQRLSRLEWVCLLLVFTGNVALSWPTGQQAVIPPFNALLGFAAMGLAAVSFLQLNAISQRYQGTHILLVYLLILLPVTLLFPGDRLWHWPTVSQWLWLGVLGTLSVANQLTLTACYKRVNAAVGGVVMMTGVLWGGILDGWLLGVRYTGWELTCFGAIFLGMVLLKANRFKPNPTLTS